MKGAVDNKEAAMSNHTESSIGNWESLSTESIYDCPVFTLLQRQSRSPHSQSVHDVYVLEAPDWVNIVPLTADGQVVMVRQYRHGIAGVTLEVPAGMMDPSDSGPLVAARREMIEETGYDSDVIESLGFTHPNPALQDNRCHTFLARDVVRRGVPQNDRMEHTEPILVPLGKIPEMIRTGAITHALAIVAFYWLMIAGEVRP